MLKQLTTILVSAVMLSAGVAHSATTLQPSPVNGGSVLLAQNACMTEVEEFPTANDEVVYVTEATECFEEEDLINIGGNAYEVEFDNASGYYFVIYNGAPWYFVTWDGALLLQNGNQFMELAL